MVPTREDLRSNPRHPQKANIVTSAPQEMEGRGRRSSLGHTEATTETPTPGTVARMRTYRNNKIQLKPVVYLVKSDSPPILNQGINSESSGLYAVMILRKSPSCMASWPKLSAPSLMWQLLAAVLILAGVYHLPVSTHVCCS